MSFLNAALAGAGAAAVAIPILIHLLFRRRRKPVRWAAMRFLMEAYRKHRRRLRLEQWLLLAARCLIVLLVALAVGRPVLSGAAAALGGGSARTVYLLIDNSLAASARDPQQAEARSALDRHKRAARDALDSLGGADRAGLIALGAPADPKVVPPSSDLAAVRSLIDELAPTDAGADLAGAFSALRGDIERLRSERGGEPVRIVILSDFLRGSADVGEPLPDALAGLDNVRITARRPAESAPGNVQITSLRPLRSVVVNRENQSGGAQQVRVGLRRTGPSVAEAGVSRVQVGLRAGAQAELARAEKRVQWAPGQSEATTVMQVAGLGSRDEGGAALVGEIDRDAVAGDNRFRSPIVVREAIRVGLVARRRFGGRPAVDRLTPADWLRLALRPSEGSPVEVEEVSPSAVDAPVLAGFDALILPRPDLLQEQAWSRIGRFARRGGLVVVFPPVEVGVHLWSGAMTESLGLVWRIAREPVEYEQSVGLSDEPGRSELLSLIAGELQDLAAPVSAHRILPIRQAPEDLEVALRLDNGEALAAASRPGQKDAEELNGRDARSAGEGDVDGRDGRAAEDGVGAGGASRGLVVYFASAPTLSWTDLPAKPLMVPLMQEIVRQGVGRAGGAWSASAGSRPLAPAGAVELRPLGGGASPIDVDADGRSAEPIRQAGLWEAMDDRGRSRGLVAVNADADAGRTDVQAPTSVRGWLAGAGVSSGSIRWMASAEDSPGAAEAGLGDGEHRSPVSLPLLIAALVVAVAELVMARLFSHASGGASVRGAGSAARIYGGGSSA